MPKLNSISKNLYILIAVALVFVIIFFSFKSVGGINKFRSSVTSFVELNEINNHNLSFDQVTKFFTDLAEKKGGRYAFQALKVARLGSNIDLHLVGHEIGDVLYKQEGVNAITSCDNDFRNACSHSIVIGLFGEKGEEALPIISDICRKAPGGIGAYTMCFHGLGHGVLAYEGYDMKKASEICQRTGTSKFGYNESIQCISGTVMEIIGGGFHDRDLWKTQRAKYLDPKKPLDLCFQDFIPSYSRFLCLDYLTPYLFEAVGADIGNPSSADLKKAFKLCDLIPENDRSSREACYGGFGKEFDGLVQGRDIRQGSINNLSPMKLKQISNWCLLAENREGIDACNIHAVNSLYWGGENNRGVSIVFCNEISDAYFKKSCFRALTNAVSYYIKDKSYRKSYCSELPDGYKEECRKILI
jgi:hypothetical protein